MENALQLAARKLKPMPAEYKLLCLPAKAAGKGFSTPVYPTPYRHRLADAAIRITAKRR